MIKILIVEDDLMLADIMEESLVEYGYEICGIARTVAEGVALGRRHKPDIAIVDLRLADGGFGTEIIAQLNDIGRFGVLYSTGNASHAALNGAKGDACLAKPFRAEELLRSLELVAEIVATGTATPPFPRGFRLLRLKAAALREAAHG